MDKIKKAFGLYLSAMDKIRTSGRRKTFTCISLILALVLIVSSTSAWFTFHDKAKIQSETFTMEASTGLRVNEGESISNVITIDNIKLSEASSVDGRNMFFPTSRNLDSANTSDMTFREGTVGDQNALYAYKSFTLTGDSEYTQIYIKSYEITVDDQTFNGGTGIVYDSNGKPVSQEKHEKCPVRIAFIEDSKDVPTVIDPTALVAQHANKYNAVDSISSTGSPFVKLTNDQAFSNYYFLNEPLITLFGTESKELTMVVWLECTADTEICDRYAEKSVSVSVELESNFTGFDRIEFIDDTLGDDGSTANGHWINKNQSCIVAMSYKDSDGVIKTVVMNQVEGSTTHWYAPMPNEITTDISFYRYSLTDDTIYNSWHTHAGINSEISSTVDGWLDSYTAHGGKLQEDRGTSVEYTAVRGNGYSDVSDTDKDKEKKRLSPCIGFWDYKGSSSGGGGGSSGDSGSIVQIAFSIQVNKDWMKTDLRSGANFYAVINGKEYKLNTDTSNYDYCKVEGLQITKGSTLTHFVLKSSNFTKTVNLKDGSTTLNSNWNYNYRTNNSDQLEII